MEIEIKNNLELKAGVIVSNQIMSDNQKVDAIMSLFEELTKWNKVEDGLPKIGSRVNYKSDELNYDGTHYIGCCDYTGERFCTQLTVIEWRCIY